MSNDHDTNPKRDPAGLPGDQQGLGGKHVHNPSPEDREADGGHKARMAVPPDSEPGLETDGHGNVIPLTQRTKDDQEKARRDRS